MTVIMVIIPIKNIGYTSNIDYFPSDYYSITYIDGEDIAMNVRVLHT